MKTYVKALETSTWCVDHEGQAVTPGRIVGFSDARSAQYFVDAGRAVMLGLYPSEAAARTKAGFVAPSVPAQQPDPAPVASPASSPVPAIAAPVSAAVAPAVAADTAPIVADTAPVTSVMSVEVGVGGPAGTAGSNSTAPSVRKGKRGK